MFREKKLVIFRPNYHLALQIKPFSGQVFSQKLLSLNEQLKTAEGSPNDDDSYLGYSLTTGDFDGNGDKTDVAVGMPRGANLTGTVRIKQSFYKRIICMIFVQLQIVLYNSNLTNLYNISGEQVSKTFQKMSEGYIQQQNIFQIGAYFGYSVTSGDFNGDGFDDLAIGSPMWTNYAIMGKYETGLVTVAYQKPRVRKLIIILIMAKTYSKQNFRSNLA